jgi:hypothetical protein
VQAHAVLGRARREPEQLPDLRGNHVGRHCCGRASRRDPAPRALSQLKRITTAIATLRWSALPPIWIFKT